MFLLHPPRLEKALAVLDTDNSGEVDVDEWETAINRGLAKRLEQMAKERERRERAAAAADEEFSAEFLTAARKVRSSVQSSPVPARAFVLLLVLCRVSLDLNAPYPIGIHNDRQGRLRVARPRGDRRVQRPFSAPARPCRDCIERQKRHRAGVASMARRS